MTRNLVVIIALVLSSLLSSLSYAGSYNNLTISSIYVSNSRVVVTFATTTGDWQGCPAAYINTTDKSFLATLLTAKNSGSYVKVYDTNNGAPLQSLIPDESNVWAREIAIIKVK